MSSCGSPEMKYVFIVFGWKCQNYYNCNLCLQKAKKNNTVHHLHLMIFVVDWQVLNLQKVRQIEIGRPIYISQICKHQTAKVKIGQSCSSCLFPKHMLSLCQEWHDESSTNTSKFDSLRPVGPGWATAQPGKSAQSGRELAPVKEMLKVDDIQLEDDNMN